MTAAQVLASFLCVAMEFQRQRANSALHAAFRTVEEIKLHCRLLWYARFDGEAGPDDGVEL